MALKTAELFVGKIQAFKDFIEECGLNHKLYVFQQQQQQQQQQGQQQEKHQQHVLFGKTIVITGPRDKKVIDFLKQVGANQGSTVKKDTFLVIAKDKNDTTTKANDARKLNITIMTNEEFIELYQ
jgi:NAD-dependent DNA ligase